MEVDLSRDMFSVTYDPSLVAESEIERVIAQLGFEPRIVDADSALGPAASTVSTTAIPEPVASALSEARTLKKLVFVDFSAEWCAPCQILHSETLPDRRVQQALEGFVSVMVDADVDLEVGRRFKLWGLPTLLVLTHEGEELFRHLGPIKPEDLAERLFEIQATLGEES